MSNEVSTKVTVAGLLENPAVKGRISEILKENTATFISSVIQITKSSKMLAKAEPNSIVASAITSATLNLPLNNNLGYAYIIPFNEKQDNGQYVTKAQFQIGYKGFIQLAQRSGQFKTINVTDVKEGEIQSVDRLSGEIEWSWIMDDKQRSKQKTIGFVAYFRLLNGFEKSLFMSIDELQGHGKRFSQTFKRGFGLWKDDFDGMGKKTVLKLLLSKYAPLSIKELSHVKTAVETDQASFNDAEDLDNLSYVDNKVEEKNENDERFKDFINSIKDEKDLEFAKSQELAESEPYKSLIEAKEVQLKLNNKKKINNNNSYA